MAPIGAPLRVVIAPSQLVCAHRPAGPTHQSPHVSAATRPRLSALRAADGQEEAPLAVGQAAGQRNHNLRPHSPQASHGATRPRTASSSAANPAPQRQHAPRRSAAPCPPACRYTHFCPASSACPPPGLDPLGDAPQVRRVRRVLCDAVARRAAQPRGGGQVHRRQQGGVHGRHDRHVLLFQGRGARRERIAFSLPP